MTAAIAVDRVTKEFRLAHERPPGGGLRARLRRTPTEQFLALDDVSFAVEHGSTVGLLGHNGSGKSTLLKCVAGILRPSAGEIRTQGRVAALLELGAGFNPELTGRENVFLNASILGLTRRETERVFDDIVAFAELERFIDLQVRHYSSGMYVRLGFAVAVNVEPDILLVDEVLSVGDEAFQRKCLDRVARFQRDGRTILVVTHAADLVRNVCDRAIVLDHGRMVADTTPGEGVRVFRETLSVPEEPEPVEVESVAAARITAVAVDSPGLTPEQPWLQPGDPLRVTVAYAVDEPVPDLVVALTVHDETGAVIATFDTATLGVAAPGGLGGHEVRFDLARVPLLDGTYPLALTLVSAGDGTVHAWREHVDHFSVMNPGRTVGVVALPVDVRFG
ncbi:MAG: ABC transporter ATP-binding protein [Actinomycetota bacterium]